MPRINHGTSAMIMDSSLTRSGVKIYEDRGNLFVCCGSCLAQIHWSWDKTHWYCSSEETCGAIYSSVPKSAGASFIDTQQTHDLLKNWVAAWSGLDMKDFIVTVQENTE